MDPHLRPGSTTAASSQSRHRRPGGLRGSPLKDVGKRACVYVRIHTYIQVSLCIYVYVFDICVCLTRCSFLYLPYACYVCMYVSTYRLYGWRHRYVYRWRSSAQVRSDSPHLRLRFVQLEQPRATFLVTFLVDQQWSSLCLPKLQSMVFLPGTSVVVGQANPSSPRAGSRGTSRHRDIASFIGGA